MTHGAPEDRPAVLVADDSKLERVMLEHILTAAGFGVVLACDGREALACLRSPDAPRLLVLDWEMPGPSGPDLVRWLRGRPDSESSYAVLLTAKDAAEDIVAGLESGADDFIKKPFRADELIARLRAGMRVLSLQRELQDKITHLEAALSEVRQLRGLIPICMHCHSIRTDGEHWQRLEAYLEEHSDASFSHALCESCLQAFYPENDGAVAVDGDRPPSAGNGGNP